MSKHTPGPFSVEYKPRMSIKGNTLVVVNGDRFPLAFVPAWDAPAEGEEDGSEEARANACLIAAAPDLLGALKALIEAYLSAVRSNAASRRSPENDTEISDARAAIAKAEGGAA